MKKTGFTFCADESTKAGVRRIADGLIAAALRCARRPSRDPVVDVHLFRTTTKRLRALWQLIRPVIARTAFERETTRLKRAAGRLATLRDRTVAGETLKALAGSNANFGHLVAAVGTGTAPANGKRQRAMRETARDLERSRRGFKRLRIGGEGWEAIGPGLMKSYRQARTRMKAAFDHPSDQAFHQWRIRVKQLHYQLEWLEPVWPRRFTKMLKRLHKLEGNLGADHDLVILRDLLGKLPEGFESTEVIDHVKTSAAKRSRRLRRACEPLGAKALGETPRRFGRRCQQHWRAWKK